MAGELFATLGRHGGASGSVGGGRRSRAVIPRGALSVSASDNALQPRRGHGDPCGRNHRSGGVCRSLGRFGTHRLQFLSGRAHLGFKYPRPPLRLPSGPWQFDRPDIRKPNPQHCRHARHHHARAVRLSFLTSDKAVGRCLRIAIVGPRDGIPGHVGLAWHQVHPHLIGLEKGPHPVVVGLGQGIVLVVVAFGAIERQA